jgi:hypothetical protein
MKVFLVKLMGRKSLSESDFRTLESFLICVNAKCSELNGVKS